MRSAERILGSCTTFLVCVSILLTMAARLFSTPILQLFGGSEATLPYAREYFNTYVLGTLFVELSTGLVCFITAQGRTTVSMLSVLLGAGLNIILDPVFIFLFHLGVQGAALATVISQAVSAAWVLLFLTGKQADLRLQCVNLRIDWNLLCAALALGVSPFVMQFTESIVSVCFNRSLLRYGGDAAVGAMTVFATMMQIATLPLQGFAQGAQPITSFNYGAKRWDRVGKNFQLLLVTSMVYSTTLWALFLVFPHFFTALFAEDAAFIGYSSQKTGYFFAMLWIMGAQYACQNMFVALGNAKTSLWLALLRKVFLLTPLIFVLPRLLPVPVNAVFLAEPAADTLAGCTTLYMFLRTYHHVGFRSRQKT